jgi:endoglucanase Acf2
MSEAETRDEVREFDADDARALALGIIESDAGRQCEWSPAAVETVAAIVLWEARKDRPS